MENQENINWYMADDLSVPPSGEDDLLRQPRLPRARRRVAPHACRTRMIGFMGIMFIAIIVVLGIMAVDFSSHFACDSMGHSDLATATDGMMGDSMGHSDGGMDMGPPPAESEPEVEGPTPPDAGGSDAFSGGPINFNATPASSDETAAENARNFVLDPNWDFGAPPQVREYEWIVRDKRHNPDGVFKPMMLVNDQYPGPLIEVNEGDTIRVNLANMAQNATSIHWHGLYQNGTNFMDGTVGVTQCPIAPGTNFTYEFKVLGQSGTYWWHAHQALQSADGLHGPLVVHAKNERTDLQKMEYATDRVVMITDHYHDPSPLLLMKYLAPDRENVEPVPDGALINGRGERNCSTVPIRECDASAEHVGRPHFHLESGKNHRLRFIHTGTFAEFQVSLDEHDVALSEVDGTDIEPLPIERLSLLPGQRYSVIVKGEEGPPDYLLRAKMLPRCFREKNKYLETDAFAVVSKNVTHDPQARPESKDWDFRVDVECRDMNTSMLFPVVAQAAPARADETFYLRANFEIGDYRLSRGFFNSSSFRPDLKHPSLLRAMEDMEHRNDTLKRADAKAWVNDEAFYRKRDFVIQTQDVATIDLLISNFDDGAHPFHLHGYKFFVLAQGHGYPPADVSKQVSTANPLRRDTATVEGYGWALFRVVADNPGMWAFHCHVGWHAESGMLMQFLTRTDSMTWDALPNANLALCDAPMSELRKGAVPPDEDFFDAA